MNPLTPDPSSTEGADFGASGFPEAPERPHGLDPRALIEAAAADALEGRGLPGSPLSVEELEAAFPQLEIGECLGRGGMGIVYRARQRTLDRMVALKLLAPERGQDVSFAQRFAQEAQALAKLNHPNIVTIHDFGQSGPFYYLVMEYVEGVNLRQAMEAGRFTPEQALAIVPPICEALHYAHGRGWVHRDIKPENVLLDRDGRVKLADFGIAKLMGQGESATGLAESQPAGTPNYMAPEQRDRTRRTDHRADIYSLGVVLYELLTGEAPAGRLEVPSRRLHIDVRLDDIVLKALETDPERRYQTAAELRTHIEEVEAAVAMTSTGDPTSAGLRNEPPEAKQVPGASASPPVAPRNAAARVLRSGTAIVTTPARLATAAGQFFLFRDRNHSLVLETDRITISNGLQTTVVPLAEITDLSIGRFPRLVNPAGLDFISLTHNHAGAPECLIIAPNKGLFNLPADWNTGVHQWWSAMRDAAENATGRPPATTPASGLGTPRSSAWLGALLLAPVFLGAVLSLLLLSDSSAALTGWSRQAPNGPGLLAVLLLTLAALTPALNLRGWSVAAPGWLGPALGLAAGAGAVVTLLGRPGFLEIVLLMALAGFAAVNLRKSGDPSGSRISATPHWMDKVFEAGSFALALALTVDFAGPHRSLLGDGQVETWTVGLSHPWLSDMTHTYPGGGQRVREMNLNQPSFYSGFGALTLWMFWLRLRSRRLGRAGFELVSPPASPGRKPRVRWGRAAVVWAVMSSLSVIMMLLVCVVMRFVLGGFPSPLPLLFMALGPVTLALMLGMRRALRTPEAPPLNSAAPIT